MTDTELTQLQQRANAGDNVARVDLAKVLDDAGRHGEALAQLGIAARAGHADAQLQLGKRLLVGRDAPLSPAHGRDWITAAASSGLVEARLLTATLAIREGRWEDGGRPLEGAAAGDASAQAQLQALGGAPLDLDYWARTPAAIGWKHDAPRVGVIESFIEPKACAWLVENARPALRRVAVNDPRTGASRADDYRSNSGAGISALDGNVVAEWIQARIAATIGIPLAQQEPTNILHYAPGQEYRPHFDFVDPRISHFARELQFVGQRVATVLIYLNDDYEGGETDFPRLNWRFKGKTGDALVFWNVSGEGAPERNSLHAGAPVTRGEKWLFSKWVRARPYPLI